MSDSEETTVKIEQANNLYSLVITMSQEWQSVDSVKAKLIIEYANDAIDLFGKSNQEKKVELRKIVAEAEQIIPPDSVDSLKKRAERIVLKLIYPKNYKLRNGLLIALGIATITPILLSALVSSNTFLRTLGTGESTENKNVSSKIDSSPAPSRSVETSRNSVARDSRIRPVRPGVSIGLLNVTTGLKAGTVCCIVKDSLGQQYLLSAETVFQGKISEPVIQPSIFGDGGSDDKVATLTRQISHQPNEQVEAGGAIARILPGVEVSSEIPGIGKIKGINTHVELGDLARIVGGFSGISEGRVHTIYMDVRLGNIIVVGSDEPETVIFTGMFSVDVPMSVNDLGSPVLNQNNELIGMVYGVSDISTIIMPIGTVLDKLHVELVR